MPRNEAKNENMRETKVKETLQVIVFSLPFISVKVLRMCSLVQMDQACHVPDMYVVGTLCIHKVAKTLVSSFLFCLLSLI